MNPSLIEARAGTASCLHLPPSGQFAAASCSQQPRAMGPRTAPACSLPPFAPVVHGGSELAASSASSCCGWCELRWCGANSGRWPAVCCVPGERGGSRRHVQCWAPAEPWLGGLKPYCKKLVREQTFSCSQERGVFGELQVPKL